MRFYNTDGSLKLTQQEFSFGWCVEDIQENQFSGTIKSQISSKNPVSQYDPDKLKSIPKSLMNSESNNVTDQRSKSHVIYFNETAGSVGDEKCKSNDVIEQCQEILTDIIKIPDNLESQTLLSIINKSALRVKQSGEFEPAHPQFCNEGGSFTLLTNPNIFKHINVIHTEHPNQFPAGPCLMDEMMFNETIKSKNFFCHAFNRQLKTSPEGIDGKFEIFRENLRRIHEKFFEMHYEIIKIKKDFQLQDKKLTALISESIKLKQEILETRYLDEILCLLQGKPEKMKSKKWPFLICAVGIDAKLDLIV